MAVQKIRPQKSTATETRDKKEETTNVRDGLEKENGFKGLF